MRDGEGAARRGAAWADQRVRAGSREQLSRRDGLLAGGASRVGWKLAFGAPGAAERWGIAGAVVGSLTDATLSPSGATHSLADWEQPVFEAEVAVAVTVGRGGVRPGGLALAIELADLGESPEEFAAVVAGDIYHRAFVLGGFAPHSGPVASAVSVERDGEPIGRQEDPAAAVGGDPAAMTAYVAEYLPRIGEELREGDVILTGSVIPPVPCSEGGRFVVSSAGLEGVEARLTV